MVGFLVFAIPATASAYSTYVGLKIESVNNPNVGSPTTWCLPAGATMTINDGITDISTVTTVAETCPLDTIWSGLVELSVTKSYDITLNTGGLGIGGFFWYYSQTEGHNCNEVCTARSSSCVDPGDADALVTCEHIKQLSGQTTCTCCADNNDYDPNWSSQTLRCNYRTSGGGSTCEGVNWAAWRVCSCAPIQFSFTFQAPAE